MLCNVNTRPNTRAYATPNTRSNATPNTTPNATRPNLSISESFQYIYNRLVSCEEKQIQHTEYMNKLSQQIGIIVSTSDNNVIPDNNIIQDNNEIKELQAQIIDIKNSIASLSKKQQGSNITETTDDKYNLKLNVLQKLREKTSQNI